MITEGHILDTGDGLSLRDSVYKTLKQAIMTGELAPDERLMEIHLANKLGVSRTPVREAIRRLEKEQLVVINPRCGAKVAGITDKDVTDALEVRLAIENMAVKLAAQNISKEQLEKLKQINHTMELAVEREDIAGISDADNNLHRAICEAGGNNVLSMITLLLEEHVLRYRVEYIRSIQDFDALLQEHKELIRALQAGDEEEASRLITVHIENQSRRICEIIQEKNK